MNVQLEEVPFSDKSILQHLMELYVYDFSEYLDLHLNEHGLFGYEYLDYYWQEEGHHPFLVRSEGKIAGFVLVRVLDLDEPEKKCSHIAEFFILKKYRRKGTGRAAAFQAFSRFPGRWQVDQIPENIPAQAFWRQIIGEYTGGDFTEDVNEDRVLQEFVSSGKPV